VSCESGVGEEAIVAAAELMAASGVAGLVWLDDGLVVRRRLGALVTFVEIGAPVTENVPALVDLDDDIAALAQGRLDRIHLPSLAIITDQGATPRLDLYVLKPKAPGFLLVVLPAVEAADSAPELARQMRLRLIAESELARAKRSLEEFAGILAHDLGAPMRAMRHLAGDLAARLEATRDADLLRLVAALEAQSRRLSGMMSALLDYASIGRLSEAVESVDTGRLIRTIVASLPRPPQMRITIGGDWPLIDTLAAPLDLVMRNLIDNALKHHDRTAGEITVSAEPRETAVIFTVADDGPGILPAHQAAIFLPFRTLADEKPVAPVLAKTATSGTGMGLALVARTIEQIGGSLSVVSDPQLARGAKFRIAWPRRIVHR
jgi:signal transduction histidine kinase